MAMSLISSQVVKVPIELREISVHYCHLFKDGVTRYHLRVGDTLVEVLEVGYDGDVFGWVFTTVQFVGSYNSTGPVARAGCDNNIAEDELVTTLHLSMDFTGPEVGSFTQADIAKQLGPNADQNGEVTRRWAVERLLKVAERRPEEAKA